MNATQRYRERLRSRTDAEVLADANNIRPDGTKLCPRCKERKHLESFPSAGKATRDGRTAICKSCAAVASKEWKLRNNENARMRERWANDIAFRERRKRQRRESGLRRSPEIKAAVRRRATLRKWGIAGEGHTPDQWIAICIEHGEACGYCGAELDLSRDHMVPLSRGGDDSITNIAPACLTCNSSKNAKMPLEFICYQIDMGVRTW